MTHDEMVVLIQRAMPEPEKLKDLDIRHPGEVRFSWVRSRFSVRFDRGIHVEEVEGGFLRSNDLALLVEHLLRQAAPPSEAPAKECEHQWATETTTLGRTYCVRCGKVQHDPLAAARPEAEPGGLKPEKHIGHTEHGDRVYAMNGICTACACPTCQATDAFVRALAKEKWDDYTVRHGWVLGADANLDPLGVVAAARRVGER